MEAYGEESTASYSFMQKRKALGWPPFSLYIHRKPKVVSTYPHTPLQFKHLLTNKRNVSNVGFTGDAPAEVLRT